ASGGNPAFSTTTTAVITASIVPTFTPIAPICSGDIAPMLPATSINGIVGTWSSGVVSNYNSGTYTFTPGVGQCANPTTMTIIVSPPIAPAFNLPNSICFESTSPMLPATSINGMVGTWSPAVVSNNNSGTYTFTPVAVQCAIQTTMTIIVSPPIIPVIATIAPICQGNVAPPLQLISTNGVSGTWSPSTIDTNYIGNYIYTFTPNSGQCALPSTVGIDIIQNPLLIISNVNNLTEIYEDDATGTLIQGLTLDCLLSGSYTYQWYKDGMVIAGANASSYAITDSWLNGITYNYEVVLTNTVTSCSGTSIPFAVTSSPVPPPMANPTQVFVPGQTLASLIVMGSNIQWYASSFGRTSSSTTSMPLPLTTLLVANTTYYASQTINGFESALRSPVTVQLPLANDQFSLKDLSFSPNPVVDFFNIKSANNITNVTIYNNLSQIVYNQIYNNLDLKIDLSQLVSGNYFVKIASNNNQQVLKVLKH
ncbi:MAG: T9SS type A sorting domain-containing protein, partial [Flavobacterium sp.]|nr:T9SS type A sorting domain-containing protein [Flavobacterium sp.]